MIKDLHHAQVVIPVGQEEAARTFYGALLGLTEIEKPAPLKQRGGLWFEVGAAQLHIGVQDGLDLSASRAHLAYEVEDLAAVRERLEAAGHRCLDGADIPGLKRFESRDPFGNRIEFVARVQRS